MLTLNIINIEIKFIDIRFKIFLLLIKFFKYTS